jgi:sulfur carrier protein
LQVILNGESCEIQEKTTLARLIEQLALAPERLAVELNREVVRRTDWPLVELKEDDHVEIVHFVGGG